MRIERGEFKIAEAALAQSSGPRADGLRARIAAGLAHRMQVEGELARIVQAAPAHEARWSVLEFQKLLQHERDPLTIELIEQTQSDAASLVAERRHASVRAAATDPAPDDAATSARQTPATSESRQLANASLAEARKSQVKGQWRTAIALAHAAEADSAAAADARLVQQSILSAARVDAEVVLGKARELEDNGQPVEAARMFERELVRFPSLAEFDSLRFESEMMSERVRRAEPARAAPPASRAPEIATGPASARGPDADLARAASSDECEALAQWRTTAGDLAGARDAWLEAARRRESASMKAENERRARELDLRIALREELADFSRVDEATARILQAHASTDDSQQTRFESIPLAELAGLVARAHVSRKAQLGWLIESIVRGDAREREIALPGLGACVQRGEIDALHASGLVARAKGAVGDGGWEFRGGAWVEGSLAKLDAAREADTVRNTRYAALIGDFRRANAAERDGLLEQIRAVADPELTSEALSKRWTDDWEKLEKNPNLRQIAAIADERRALDAAREKALGLIFDEVRYFYPYNPPECPPEKAAKYAGVQREVDELVTAVRLIWERSKRVKIGDGLRQQLEAAGWTAARAEEAGVEIEPVAAPWRFALALPDTADVGLTDFAWDEQERAKLVESQRIEARNERLWTALDRAKPGDDVPNSDEQNQVRITNAYRSMLGRRALAWNPKIESAAQGHSDHMANTGDFSHFEKGDPKRATPFDRMRLAGYKDGVSENICMGRGDPKSAHEGWTQSSGHHRNILMRDHREMASAIASSYWTQNFGMDASFLTDL